MVLQLLEQRGGSWRSCLLLLLVMALELAALRRTCWALHLPACLGCVRQRRLCCCSVQDGEIEEPAELSESEEEEEGADEDERLLQQAEEKWQRQRLE